jgi:hypothetical protein
MNPREKNLLIILIVTLVLAVVVGGGYFGFYQPWSEKNAQADALAKEIAEKEAKLKKLREELPTIRNTLSRSLPSDFDIARQEYDAALYRMLREAKVPSSSVSIKPRASEGKTGIPEINKRPAYQKVAFEVNMEKVSYGTILDVLYRYYNLNLLHQITKFNIRKSQDASSARRVNSSLSDKNDLNVTLVTEAIIMDGAEDRATLYPVPPALGALGGGAGLRSIMSTPEVGRLLKPTQFASALAYADRNYQLMLVKDIFHGSPPPPPKPKPIEKEPEPEPKEDTSAFIRLTGLGRNSDGTGSAVIEDVASKHEYMITIKSSEGKLQVDATKVYFLKGNRKKVDMDGPAGTLQISDESSSTSRTFKVIGINGDELVMVGPEATPARPAVATFGPGAPRPGTSTRRTAPPSSAIIGGILVAMPQEKVYAWKHGDPLNKIRELPKEESQKAILKASTPETAPKTPAVRTGL